MQVATMKERLCTYEITKIIVHLIFCEYKKIACALSMRSCVVICKWKISQSSIMSDESVRRGEVECHVARRS